MAGYLDASGLKHFKRKNDATYLGKQEKAASAKVADSVVWENVSGRPDLSALIPPGTIIHYAGRTVPSGWLICNGANVSRTDYAALFAAIGTIYGAGNGVDNLWPAEFERSLLRRHNVHWFCRHLPLSWVTEYNGSNNKLPTPWTGLLYEQNGGAQAR